MATDYRVALVGVGKIARDQHVRAIAADARFRLAATVDHLPLDEGVRHFVSLGELLASGVAVDAVAVCTPPQVRCSIARQAIQAGLPTLLEKPPAATPGEFADLKAMAAAHGVPCLLYTSPSPRDS